MKAFVFRSRKDAKVVGYTEFADGGNLPNEFAPWIPQGAANIEPGGRLAGIGLVERVISGIQQDGVFVARGKVRVTRFTMPRR